MTEKRSLSAPRGLYFEDYEVGMAVDTPGRTITEADIVNFAGLTGDWNPLHTDAVYAGQHLFGQRVAHGALIFSLAVGLAVRLGFLEETLLAFRQVESWKFSQPVFIGDTIRVRLTVSETRPVRRMGGGMVTLLVAVQNQNDQVVQQGHWSVLLKSRPDEGITPLQAQVP